MQKIFVLKNFKSFKEGQSYMVGNNEAHSLIDGGFAVLFKFYKAPKVKYTDKMMRPNAYRSMRKKIIPE